MASGVKSTILLNAPSLNSDEAPGDSFSGVVALNPETRELKGQIVCQPYGQHT